MSESAKGSGICTGKCHNCCAISDDLEGGGCCRDGCGCSKDKAFNGSCGNKKSACSKPNKRLTMENGRMLVAYEGISVQVV